MGSVCSGGTKHARERAREREEGGKTKQSWRITGGIFRGSRCCWGTGDLLPPPNPGVASQRQTQTGVVVSRRRRQPPGITTVVDVGFQECCANTRHSSTISTARVGCESRKKTQKSVLGCWFHGQMVTRRSVTAGRVFIIVSHTCPGWTRHKRNTKDPLNSTRTTPTPLGVGGWGGQHQKGEGGRETAKERVSVWKRRRRMARAGGTPVGVCLDVSTSVCACVCVC